jgi:hypothetical protein
MASPTHFQISMLILQGLMDDPTAERLRVTNLYGIQHFPTASFKDDAPDQQHRGKHNVEQYLSGSWFSSI